MKKVLHTLSISFLFVLFWQAIAMQNTNMQPIANKKRPRVDVSDGKFTNITYKVKEVTQGK